MSGEQRYLRVQRRGSAVAHLVPVLDGVRGTGTLCGQSAPGHSSWGATHHQPLCKRCIRKLGPS